MKNLKNMGLIVLSLLILALAVGGLFAFRQVFKKSDAQVPTPEPVAVETKTEEPKTNFSEEPAPTAAAPGVTENPEGKDLREKVERVMASMSLQEKIGQMFIVDFSQLGGSSNTSINQRTKDRLNVYPVGGILLSSRNIVSNTQVTAFIQELQRNTATPLFIAVEEEGGDHTVLGSNSNIEIPQVKGAAALGEAKDLEGAKTAASQIGTALKEIGFNFNLAPVADVITVEEGAVLQNRSFGRDARFVSQMVEAQVAAYQSAGISASLKYFPGYGGASQSTQEGYVETLRTKEEMSAQEWLPYITGIKAGADSIMMSNIAAPSLTGGRTPCSLSKRVVTELLRGELGYNGMILSGPLNETAITRYYSSSEAVLMAIDAGVDVMFLPASLDGTYAAIESAVKNGTVSMERIDQSVSRILAVKIVRGLINPEDYPEIKPTPDPEEQNWSGEDEQSGENWSEGDWSGEDGSEEDRSEEDRSEENGSEENGSEENGSEEESGENQPEENAGSSQ